MRKSKITAILASVLILTLLVLPGFALSPGDRVIPGGMTVGIRIDSPGPVITGFSPEYRGIGLKEGDVIISVNGSDISAGCEISEAMEGFSGGKVKITVLRENEKKNYEIETVISNGTPRLGIFLRDGISGIGTVTYIDPESGEFGSLGHGISDPDTGKTVPFAGGTVYDSVITGVEKGQKGDPGQLVGDFKGQGIGKVKSNCLSGVYGVFEGSFENGDTVETAAKSEVKCGDAFILCRLCEGETEYYTAEIIKIFRDGSARDFMIKVTDKRLIDKTGGIVQGMSGSPIIQNGRLVGAVTHVMVNDPAKGYGISVEKMFLTAA